MILATALATALTTTADGRQLLTLSMQPADVPIQFATGESYSAPSPLLSEMTENHKPSWLRGAVGGGVVALDTAPTYLSRMLGWGHSSHSNDGARLETAYTLAKLAKAVYTLDHTVCAHGEDDACKTALDTDTGDYEVLRGSIVNMNSGIKLAVWKNAENGNTVLAIKGTNPKSSSDDYEDLLLVLGGAEAAARAEAVKAKAAEWIKKFGVNMITGHSLGAYHAEIVATNEGLPGIAFCAPGVNGPKQRLGGEVTAGFHNVNFKHDALGNVNALFQKHVQLSVYVPNPTSLVTHSIDGMVAYFKRPAQQKITNVNILKFAELKRFLGIDTGYYLADDWAGTCYLGNSC